MSQNNHQAPIIPDSMELALAVVAMPSDMNMQGVIFGGWTLAQLDLAASIPARRIAAKTKERAVTKAVNHVDFVAPILVGDKVDFYTAVKKVGRSSITIDMQGVAERYDSGELVQVVTAEYVYVRLTAD